MDAIEWVTLVSTVLTLLTGLFGYLFITIVIAREKTLRTATNILIVSLGIFDIVLVVVSNPMSVLHTSEGQKFVPGVTSLQTVLNWMEKCDAIQGITTFGSTGHVLCMLALVADRVFYMSACQRYVTSPTKKVYGAVIVCIVILATAYATVAIETSGKLEFGEACWFSTRIDVSYNRIIWVPLLILTLLAFLAFYIVFFITCSAKGTNDVAMTGTEQQTQPDHNDQAPTAGNINGQSNTELQITWAIVVFVTLFIPSYLTNYVILLKAGENGVQYYEPWVYHVAFWVNNIHLCVNPVVYSLMHQKIRSKLKLCSVCKSPGTVHPVEALVFGGATQQPEWCIHVARDSDRYR